MGGCQNYGPLWILIKIQRLIYIYIYIGAIYIYDRDPQ